MVDLIRHATNYRAYADWGKVADNLAQPSDYVTVVERLQNSYNDLREAYVRARRIIQAAPGSDGARVLSEMLALGEEKLVLAPSFKTALRKRYVAMKRKQRACGDDGPVSAK